MRGGIAHHPGTDEPGPQQEQAQHDDREPDRLALHLQEMARAPGGGVGVAVAAHQPGLVGDVLQVGRALRGALRDAGLDRLALDRGPRLGQADPILLRFGRTSEHRGAAERHRQRRQQVQRQSRGPPARDRPASQCVRHRTEQEHGDAEAKHGLPRQRMPDGARRAERRRQQEQHHAQPQQHLRLGGEHDHQQQGAGGVAEEDVAGPHRDEMQGAERGQRQRAPQVGPEEAAAGHRRARQHHREAHPEQQREHRPELAADEDLHEPAGPVVEAGGAQRQPGIQVADRPVEELDVHQRDAQQGDPADDVQRLDAVVGGDRPELCMHVPSPDAWRLGISASRGERHNAPEVTAPSGMANGNGPLARAVPYA